MPFSSCLASEIFTRHTFREKTNCKQSRVEKQILPSKILRYPLHWLRKRFVYHIRCCGGLIRIVNRRMRRNWYWSRRGNWHGDWCSMDYMGRIIGIVILLPRLTRTGWIAGAWAPIISISVSEVPTNSRVRERRTDGWGVGSGWGFTLSFCAVEFLEFHICVVKIFLGPWTKVKWNNLTDNRMHTNAFVIRMENNEDRDKLNTSQLLSPS